MKHACRHTPRCAFGPAHVLWVLALVVGAPWGGLAQDATDETETPIGNSAVIIRLQGMITPITPSYIERKLATAERDGADLVIIEIDSPGGELFASLEIAQMLDELDWAKTVAYVPGPGTDSEMRAALSGAAFVALGCDRIILGPRAQIGDAGVIESDGTSPFRYVPEKQLTHVVSTIRGLAKSHDRPPALAEAMVDKDLEVFRVRNTTTGEETCMSQKELDSAEDGDDWEKGKPIEETLGGNFLELDGTRAVELGLAEGTAESREELLEQLGVAGRPRVLEWTAVDTLVMVLNFPLVTVLIFVIGLVALYIEMSSPGIGVGILTAGLCFALFFWSRYLGGTAEWLEIVLFLAGIGFLAVELFVLPGFVVAGLSGMLLLGVSLVLASHKFIIPESGQELAALTTTLSVIAGSIAAFAVIATFMNRYFGALPILSRLMLQPPVDAAAAADVAAPGQPALGDRGVADSALRPSGRARFGHRMLDVMTDGEFIQAGEPVEIVQISGRRIFVAPPREETT